MIDAVMVDEGLLIPKSLLTKLGTEDFEVLTRGREIVIRPKSKTRQYYGFVGETDYDEEFIKELERDFEESGWDHGLESVRDSSAAPTVGPTQAAAHAHGCAWVRRPWLCVSMCPIGHGQRGC